jgi:tRNA (guanine-N7-)-methyltransferase
MGPELVEAWESGRARFEPVPWDALPPRTLLEIGSGMGEALLAAAPVWDLAIGADVHVRGLAATIRGADTGGLVNVRLCRADAVDLLRHTVLPGSLAAIHVWFPDPWPKARHHKRRLVRPGVAELLARALSPGGELRLATDIGDYAEQMQRVLASVAELEPAGPGGVVPRPAWRPRTKYERAGLAAGRTPVDLAYRRRLPAGALYRAPRESKSCSAAASSHRTAD